MAPGRQVQRRSQAPQGEHLFKLGEVGRKTGVTVPDTGERDEHGMELDDGLFSSPEKSPAKSARGAANGRDQSESDDEQDMDLDDVSPDGPATISRKRNRVSIPKARSPVKTFLNSPARQNPHLDRQSSPTRGDVVTEQEQQRQASQAKTVKRKLDFSAEPQLKPATNGQSKVNGKLTNGRTQHDESDDDKGLQGRNKRSQKLRQVEAEDEEEDEEEEPMEVLNMGADDDMEPSVQEEAQDEVEPEEQGEEEEEDETAEVEEEKPPTPKVKPSKTRGRKPKVQEAHISPPPAPAGSDGAPAKRRGRPAKAAKEEPEPSPKSPKRRRSGKTSSGGDEDSAEVPGPKRQKTEKTAKAGKASSTSTKAPAKTPAAKSKVGRKRKSSGVGVDSPAVVPRPPMPKSRGLQILRREKLDDTGVRTTRSGRVSARPLAFWRGERYEYDTDNEDTIRDKNGRVIKVGSKIKEIVRVDAEDEGPKTKRRGRPGKAVGRPRRRRSEEEDEDDDERDEWEDDPGRVTGEVIYWYPEHELNPPQGDDQVEVTEEELAISQAAIQMKDIKDATFRFAKTLTMPFFGSGIVDLPPNSEKRLKNSRKMQMVFFVHYGWVQVTIAQTTFRIGKGGQWFVPRGNYYSIENDTEKPARIFFAQGCEILVKPENQEI